MKQPARLAAALVVAALAPIARAQCPPLLAVDPGGGLYEELGASVAFDGTTLVSGRAGVLDEGGVLVWRKVGSELVLEAEIESVTGFPVMPFSALGAHVAVDGDDLAIVGIDPSVLALFRRTVDPVDGSVSWEEDAVFALSDGVGLLGQAVALDGDLVAVGIVDSAITTQSRGEVAYSRRSGGTWGAPQSIFSPTPEAFGYFGNAVDIRGSTLAVVSRFETGFGRVHVFDFNSSTGAFVHRSSLTNTAGGNFGESVRVGGTGIVPSVYVSNYSASLGSLFNVGHVRVYTEQLQPFPNPPIWVLNGTITASDPQTGAEFGRSIDLHQPFFGTTRLVVGAPGRGDGAVYLFESSGNGFEEVRVLDGLPAGAGDAGTFGHRVAVAGSTLAATHRLLDGPDGAEDVDQGAAVIHELDPAACPLDCTQPRLAGEALTELARFGEDVAIAGDTALVGVPLDDFLGEDAGAVRVYRRLGGCWFYDSTMRASDGQPGDYFGNAVAIDSDADYAIVGARHRDSQGVESSGAAYVFLRTGAVWVETALLEPPSAHDFGLFGWDVDIEFGAFPYAVVGEPRTLFDTGRAHRFDYNFFAETWGVGDSYTSPFLFFDQGDEFGRSVAASPSFFAIGDPRADIGTSVNGAVVGYRRDFFTGAWQSTGTVIGATGNERFGEAVATNGVSLVVGAPLATVNGFDFAGRVYSFGVSTTGTMTANGSATAPFPFEGATLGQSVALEGVRVVAGAEETFAGGTGSVHMFDLVPGGLAHAGEILPPGAVSGARFGAAVAIDGTELLVGAPFDDSTQSAEGSAWIFGASGARTFEVDRSFVSQSEGGKQSFALNMGQALAGHIYWIVGSATGTSPGVPFPPFVLPLTFDVYYKIMLKHPNGQIFQKTLGLLDANGRAQAAFAMPPGAPILAGAYHHAALILDPLTLAPTGATNATVVTFVP